LESIANEREKNTKTTQRKRVRARQSPRSCMYVCMSVGVYVYYVVYMFVGRYTI